MNRTGELGAVPIRTDRFFAVNSSWYFDVREGPAFGPYSTKQQAMEELSRFIKYMQGVV